MFIVDSVYPVLGFSLVLFYLIHIPLSVDFWLWLSYLCPWTP